MEYGSNILIKAGNQSLDVSMIRIDGQLGLIDIKRTYGINSPPGRVTIIQIGEEEARALLDYLQFALATNKQL